MNDNLGSGLRTSTPARLLQGCPCDSALLPANLTPVPTCLFARAERVATPPGDRQGPRALSSSRTESVARIDDDRSRVPSASS